MQKSSMENKMTNNTWQHVAVASTGATADWNTKFKWSDDLVDFSSIDET